MNSVSASRKSNKSATLAKFGFTGITATTPNKTLTSFEKTLVKQAYVCDGREYNIKGSVEANILIDGSHREYKEKLIRIIAWSSNEPKFSNASLYVHMLDSFTQFSSSQREAIDNVYYKWRVFAKI